MKCLRFLTAFLLLLPFCGAVLAQNLLYEQEPERQFLAQWTEDGVTGSGRHQPYAILKLYDAHNTLLWEGRSDVRGFFEFAFTQNKFAVIGPQILLLRAFDQFDREIKTAQGEPDVLKRELPHLRSENRINPPLSIPPDSVPPSPISPLPTPDSSLHSSAPETNRIFWPLFLGIILCGAAGIGGFFLWRQKPEALS